MLGTQEAPSPAAGMAICLVPSYQPLPEAARPKTIESEANLPGFNVGDL